MKNDNLVLVGFMGTGKTTVGRILAVRLGWRFADMDAAIEEREGRTIPEIFTAEGEVYFREAESRVLAELLAEERQVISTGGGAVLAERNRELMKEKGLVVSLGASAETIIARVRHDANRPLLKGGVEARVHALMEERRHAYDFADFTVKTDGLDTGRIAAMILNFRKSAGSERE